MSQNALLIFTKPTCPGRVKTRLIGELSAEQAAELHAAFRDDLCDRLGGQNFHTELAWALEEGEDMPASDLPGQVQEGADLGERLYHALAATAERFDAVAAVGSDHPELTPEIVEEAFAHLESGTDLVLGPVPDGGYFLIGLRREAVRRELFDGIAWSSESVLCETLTRAAQLGYRALMLAKGHDIDRPEDLHELEHRLAESRNGCPRTRRLLESWGRL